MRVQSIISSVVILFVSYTSFAQDSTLSKELESAVDSENLFDAEISEIYSEDVKYLKEGAVRRLKNWPPQSHSLNEFYVSFKQTVFDLYMQNDFRMEKLLKNTSCRVTYCVLIFQRQLIFRKLWYA